MRKLLSRKRFIILISAFLVSLCLVLLGISYWFQRSLHNKSTVVILEKGASLSQITTLLQQQGVLDFPLLFKAIIYGTHSWHQLKAGEYFLPPSLSPAQLIHILKSGSVVLHPVTVIEGETSYGFTQKLLRDDRFQESCEIPLEGSLLPETYHFPRGTHRQKIISHLQTAMSKGLKEVWSKRSSHGLHSPEELVILASIVEKETCLEAEKPVVAAVFLNRLKKGMPLQACPTVLYSLTKGQGSLGRDLLREDLAIQSPYNTYLNIGLPPSPIANPSLASLKAVANPADVPYLYFVADGSGGHIFATTLKEHQKNHATWRKLKKEMLKK